MYVSNATVSASTAGLDTTKLSKIYKVNSPQHDYEISFCDTSKKTRCPGDDVGVCQILSDGTTVVAGKMNTR